MFTNKINQIFQLLKGNTAGFPSVSKRNVTRSGAGDISKLKFAKMSPKTSWLSWFSTFCVSGQQWYSYVWDGGR